MTPRDQHATPNRSSNADAAGSIDVALGSPNTNAIANAASAGPADFAVPGSNDGAGPAIEASPDPGPIGRPISRRRALAVLGVGAVAAGGGLGTILAGCGPSLPDYPVWATLGIDPEALPVNEPVNVPFTATWENGSLDTSTWLVRSENGTLTAYNPFCTHAACEYDWADGTDQFVCACHDASFALDGTVLTGPPPRPLDRWALRSSAGSVEVEITGQVAPSPTAG